jgi:hypothetical protein
VIPYNAPEAEAMVSVAGSLSGRRKLRLLRLGVSFVMLCGLAGCGNDSSDADAVNLQCAKQRYANYNPKNMNQCVDVCITCGKGTMTTCSTSCTMRGAK